MIGKLEYCGAGQIRDAKTKRLVSPREIVKAWNESSAVDVAAALVYAAHGDWRRLIYWLAAATLTATVTF